MMVGRERRRVDVVGCLAVEGVSLSVSFSSGCWCGCWCWWCCEREGDCVEGIDCAEVDIDVVESVG